MLPYEKDMSAVRKWQDPESNAVEAGDRGALVESASPSPAGGEAAAGGGVAGTSSVSPRHASASSSSQQRGGHSSFLPSAVGATTPRKNIIPLRHQPVTVPPPPFAPKSWKAPKLQLAPGSETAKSRYMMSIDSRNEEGSRRRERIASARSQSASGGKWRSCANPQGFFCESEKPSAPPEKVVMSEEEREGIVKRLAVVPPPPKPLPPICAKWSMSEEDEAAMVERLSQPFEREPPEEPEQRILDDEELDEMVQRLYRKPVEATLESRGLLQRE